MVDRTETRGQEPAGGCLPAPRDAAEATLWGFLKALPTGAHLYQVADDGRLVFLGANAASDRILRTSCAAAIGKTIEEAFPALAGTDIPAHYREAALEAISWHAEHVTYDHGRIRGAFGVQAVPLGSRRMVALFSETTKRRQTEQAWHALVRAGNRVGSHFFSELVPELAALFGARYAQVSRLLPGASGRARTLAVWADGRLVENLEYELSDAPCGETLHREICFYPDGVQEQFPHSRLLAQLGVRSYLGMPLYSSSGHPIGLLAVLHDEPMREFAAAKELLTVFAGRAAAELERVLAEEAHLEATRRLQALFEYAQDAIFILDPETGLILDVNRQAEVLMKRPRAELVGMHQSELHPPEEPERNRGLFRRHYDQPQTTRVEAEIYTRDSGRVPVEISFSLVDLGDGRQVIQGFFRNLTERKRAEERLLQVQKMETVGRLAGGVAHDFNNLLMVISGYVELLQRAAALPPDTSARLKGIEHAIDRAAGLTQQLLAFSRKQLVEPVLLDLNRTVEEATKMLRRVIGEDIELLSTLAAAPLPIVADPAQLSQVLLNLAVNARDAMPSGGTLALETRHEELGTQAAMASPGAQPGRYAVLKVRDSGTGMPKEVRDRVFEPFFSTKEPGRGTGLGLSTAYGIVSQMGGFIRVESLQGEGSTFEVWLPFAPVSSASEDSAGFGIGTETVLLVEDEDRVRELVGGFLRARGFTVLDAPRPDLALGIEARHSGPIHLLLTDVVMPRMSGRELADRLRGLRPGLRVLYMSGHAELGMNDDGLGPGAHFLRKPFRMQELVRKVREVLDSPRP